MLRRYASGFASGFASGVCFGVCFACTSSHGTYFISKRLPKIFPTFCISLCVSLQGCEVSYSRVQNVPGSGSWRFEVWNGYDSGMIRVWFGYASRSTIQHTVSDLDRSYNGQSAPEAGWCKRYRLPQWSYSGQSAPKLSSTYLAA